MAAYQLTSAESIRKKTVNNPAIKDHVKNILKDIDEKISDISSRDSKVTIKLPKDIFIDGLTMRNAQRIVYYKVIKEITDKGYDLTIDTKPDFLLTIQWVTDMEKNSAKEIDKFIAQYTRGVKEEATKSEGKKKSPIKHVVDIFDEAQEKDNDVKDFFEDEPL